MAKPDGLIVVAPDDEGDFLDPLPIRLIWGVGPTTERRLHSAGISTIGQLAKVGSPILGRLLGQGAGTKLAALAVNVDTRAVETQGGASPWAPRLPLDGRRPLQSSSERHLAICRTELPVACGKQAWRVGGSPCGCDSLRCAPRHAQSHCRFAISTTLTLSEAAAKAGLLSHPRERTRTSYHAPRRFSLQLERGAFPPTGTPTRSPRRGLPRPSPPRSLPMGSRPVGRRNPGKVRPQRHRVRRSCPFGRPTGSRGVPPTGRARPRRSPDNRLSSPNPCRAMTWGPVTRFYLR